WTATWDLAAAPDWRYAATLALRDSGGSWKVVPAPTTVHPDLGTGQHLRLVRQLPDRAAVQDASGAPIFTPTDVVEVGVDPGKVTDLPGLAAALAAATGLTAEEITQAVQKGKPGQFVSLITLRRADFEARSEEHTS